MFKLTIRTDNAAFEDDQCSEVARILRELADNIDDCRDNASGYDGYLRDYNGNSVGEWSVDARGGE